MMQQRVDIAIVGAGSAGLAAYRAAREALPNGKIVLIEGGPHGTTCARVGCMPSKLLIAAADAAHHAELAPRFGVDAGPVHVDGRAVMARVRAERDRFVGFVVKGVEELPASDRVQGRAHFLSNHELRVGDRIIQAKRVILATGSRPTLLPMFEGLGDRLIVNDDIFDWQELPESVAVFGPGVIGLELGQALHRLGVRVRMFGVGGLVGPLTDPELLEYARQHFGRELGLDADAKVTRVWRDASQAVVEWDDAGELREERFDYVLAATGRRPNIDRVGLDNTTLELDHRGVPNVDPHTLQAGDTHIFIAGDAASHRPILHEAADEGRIAGVNAARYPHVEPGERRSPLAVVFSDPQMALAGETHRELREAEQDFVVGRVSFEDQGRSRVMLRNHGLLHVYVDANSRRLLGAEALGPDVEHLGHLLAWAHQLELTVDEILRLPFYHPVVEEGLRTALRDACRQLQSRGHLARCA